MVKSETKEINGGVMVDILESLVSACTGGFLESAPVYETIITDDDGNTYSGVSSSVERSQEKASDAYHRR
jgi:hypothetical protein